LEHWANAHSSTVIGGAFRSANATESIEDLRVNLTRSLRLQVLISRFKPELSGILLLASESAGCVPLGLRFPLGLHLLRAVG